MASIPLALSIHNFINKVGADAGFASIIGLAILVLLYFAQARETATLRDHAADAAERIQNLEGRISQMVRAQSAQAAQSAGAPAAARLPGRPAAGPIVASRGVATAAGPATAAAVAAGVGAGFPAAPAGVGAPALTAATKLIPTPGPASLEPVTPEPVAPEPVAPVALQEPDIGSAPPPPATVAGAGNGHSYERLAPYGGAPSPVPALSGPAQPPPRVQIRPGQPPAPSRRPVAAPRPATGGNRPGSSRRILAAVAGALVLAAVVIGLLALTSGGSSPARTGSQPVSNAPTRTRRAQAAGVNPANVTVAVLNGTATAKLANRVGGVLSAAGYKDGTITNAPDQTHTATVVAYLPSFKKDALAVAKSLKVPASSVQAIDQNTQAVACPAAPAACPANVVVTVGANLAGTQ